MANRVCRSCRRPARSATRRRSSWTRTSTAWLTPRTFRRARYALVSRKSALLVRSNLQCAASRVFQARVRVSSVRQRAWFWTRLLKPFISPTRKSVLHPCGDALCYDEAHLLSRVTTDRHGRPSDRVITYCRGSGTRCQAPWLRQRRRHQPVTGSVQHLSFCQCCIVARFLLSDLMSASETM